MGIPKLDAELLGLLPRLELPLRASLLDVLAFRRVDAVSFLEKLPVQEEDAALFVSVLRASRWSARPVAGEWVRRGLAESRPPVDGWPRPRRP